MCNCVCGGKKRTGLNINLFFSRRKNRYACSKKIPRRKANWNTLKRLMENLNQDKNMEKQAAQEKKMEEEEEQEEVIDVTNEEDENVMEEIYQRAYKFRKIEDNRMMALCSVTSDKTKQTRMMLPKPVKVTVQSSGRTAIFYWGLSWNMKYPCFTKSEVVLSVVKIDKDLDLDTVDPLTLIFCNDGGRERFDHTLYVHAPTVLGCAMVETEMDFRLDNVHEHLKGGEYFVVVWTRPLHELNGSPKNSTIHFSSLTNSESKHMKLYVRQLPPKPQDILASRISENIAVLRWGYTLSHPGIIYTIRMEIYDEKDNTWKIKENSESFTRGLESGDLAFPRLHIMHNITGARKIAIPGIPRDSKCRFSVFATDAHYYVNFDYKKFVVISGGDGEIVFSNILESYNENDDSDKTVCTICYDRVSLDTLLTNEITEVPLNELHLQPGLDPLCPSGPNTCCHIFHAKCLHDWSLRTPNPKCPNCQRQYNQEIMFKRFEHILCVPAARVRARTTAVRNTNNAAAATNNNT